MESKNLVNPGLVSICACKVPVFNYSVACDTSNREPLFYEVYPGSINYEGDQKKRHIHIYYSDGRAYGEKQEIRKYFYLHFEKDGKTLKLAEENTKAVEKDLSLAGYFAIASSDNMTAKEVIDIVIRYPKGISKR